MHCAVVVLTCLSPADESELLSIPISFSVLLHRLRGALNGTHWRAIARAMRNITHKSKEGEDGSAANDPSTPSRVYHASSTWTYDRIVQFSLKLKLTQACNSKEIDIFIGEDCHVVLDSRWNSMLYSPFAISSSSTSTLQYDAILQNTEVVNEFGIASRILGTPNISNHGTGNDTSSHCASILLSGPSGSGKTSLVAHHAVRMYAKSTVVCIRCGEVMARYFEENAASPVDVLMEAFKTAFVATPSIVIFDDLDHLLSMDSSLQHTEEVVKFICQFLQIIASMKRNANDKDSCDCGMLVIGCVESLSKLNSNILDLFDFRINIPLPIARERRNIIKRLYEYHSKKSDIVETSNATYYEKIQLKTLYSYADSKNKLSFGAFLFAAYDFIMKIEHQNVQSKPETANSIVRNLDRNFFVNTEICGHEKEKQVIHELIAWPRVHTELYKLFNVKPIIGILLYGPPGTGKTLLAKVCAQELECSFVNIRIPDIVRGHIGTGEQKLRDLFIEAKLSAPCIVFIDEFQSIFTSRRDDGNIESSNTTSSSLSSTLAGCFDDLSTWNEHAGIESMVTVIAATNEPWSIDRSFIRPGRLEKSLYIGTLDEVGRKQIIKEQIRMMKTGCVDVDVSDNDDDDDDDDNDVVALTAHTINFTGADMKYMCRKASMELRKHQEKSSKEGNKDTAIDNEDKLGFNKQQFLQKCLSLVIHKTIQASQVLEERRKLYRNWC